MGGLPAQRLGALGERPRSGGPGRLDRRGPRPGRADPQNGNGGGGKRAAGDAAGPPTGTEPRDRNGPLAGIVGRGGRRLTGDAGWAAGLKRLRVPVEGPSGIGVTMAATAVSLHLWAESRTMSGHHRHPLRRRNFLSKAIHVQVNAAGTPFRVAFRVRPVSRLKVVGPNLAAGVAASLNQGVVNHVSGLLCCKSQSALEATW